MRNGFAAIVILGGVAAGLCGPVRAETVMQQCGHQYQDAKAAGTLNGMSWNQFRSDCAARLKAQPAATTAAPATPAATQTQAANPLNPAPATAAAAPAAPAAPAAATPTAKPAPSAGRAAFLVREKQCGAEWRS
ncbi:MAG: hypothetical protein INR64_16475, partial [Caulobacteraceae bacterium]|nr:hypothetical protein [Caulobacter sp.]